MEGMLLTLPLLRRERGVFRSDSRKPPSVLPVLPAHIPELLALPMHHRDPFDRLLIAQARAEGMALATADDQIRKYRVAMAW